MRPCPPSLVHMNFGCPLADEIGCVDGDPHLTSETSTRNERLRIAPAARHQLVRRHHSSKEAYDNKGQPVPGRTLCRRPSGKYINTVEAPPRKKLAVSQTIDETPDPASPPVNLKSANLTA